MKILFLLFFLCNGCINSKEISEGYDNAVTPNIMVNNRHYSTTGEVQNVIDHGPDGTITSSVDDLKYLTKMINLILELAMSTFSYVFYKTL